MELEDIFNASSDKSKRIERRVRFNADQIKQLDDISKRLDIPFAALVRLAVDCFIPRTTNMSFKEEGIKAVWNGRRF